MGDDVNPITSQTPITPETPIEGPIWKSGKPSEVVKLQKNQEQSAIGDVGEEFTAQSRYDRPDIVSNHHISMENAPNPLGLGKLIQKIKNFVQKKLNTEAYKAKTANAADTRIETSRSMVQTHREFSDTFNLKDANALLQVPHELFLSPKDIKGTYKDKAVVAKKAVLSEAHKQVGKVEVEGVGTLVPVGFSDESVSHAQITPTSYILGKGKEDSETNHLMNAYYIEVEGQQRALIRCGKIDTAQRADEFFSLIEKVRNDIVKETGNSDFKMRIVSQQLNGFEREGKMIHAQHRYIAQLNDKMKQTGMGEIVHINLPSNRMYQMTKAVRKFGILGRLIENKILKGEKLSKEQNLESWGTYLKWLNEDLYAATGKKLDTLQIEKAVAEVNQLVQQIEVEKEKAKAGKISDSQMQKTTALLKKDLAEQRAFLKVELQRKYEELKHADTLIDDPATKRKLVLMKEILGTQVDVPGVKPMHRGKEGMMIEVLNRELGLTMEKNCKSGLDRTGMWHSLGLSLEQIGVGSHERDERATNLALHWERVTHKINLAVATKGNEGVEELLKTTVDEKEKTLLLDAIELRKRMLTNLIDVSMPITFASTGVLGLKWNKGMQENLLPLNFLPPFVNVVDDKGKETTVSLVNFDKTGRPVGMTTAGRQLLTKFSSLRGS